MAAPNVLLLIMDSVRAKNVGAYGYDRNTTPFLDEFAERAIRYEQARAPGVGSVQSHASMFTGRHVLEHRMTDADRLASGTSVFESLRDDHGYATALFTTNEYVVSETFGLNAGFEYCSDDVGDGSNERPGLVPTEFTPDPDGRVPGEVQFGLAALTSGHPVASLRNGLRYFLKRSGSRYAPRSVYESPNETASHVDRFLEWHAEQDDQWAAVINTMDAHLPYEPEPAYNVWGDAELKRIQAAYPGDWDYYVDPDVQWMRHAQEDLYDGCIYQIDQGFETLIGALEARGDLDDTLVVVTADHREGFGEPGRVRGVRTVGHGRGVAEELLRVPLVVKLPSWAEAEADPDPSRVVSLTALPSLIEEVAVDGEADRLLEPDGPVVAGEIEHGDARNTESVPDELDPALFDGLAAVVYRDRGECVEKQVVWGDDEATIDCRTPRDLTTVADSVDDVSAATDVERDPDLLERGASAIDAETEERLRHLGYR